MKTKNLLSLFPLLLVTTSLALSGCASTTKVAADPCLKRRGAIDIGSGSTKAFAAVVDICQTPKRIVEKLFDEKVKIAFGESLERNADGQVPADVMADGAAKIASFAEEMNAKNLESIAMVATAAIRKAKNGPDVANAISEAVAARLKGKTKLDLATTRVQILSQIDEADVGARSALTNLPPSPNPDQTIIVWDIGGGSMQMWSAPVPPATAPTLFTGTLASVTFKNQVIHDIQKKDPTVKTSPNPLKPNAKNQDVKKAVQLARAHAKANVAEFFKTNGPTARWIGIGGVHGISILKQTEKVVGRTIHGVYDEAEVSKTLNERATRKDEELESEFSATEVTNLALVLGYMQELKIPRVETVEASLVQGLITRY